VALTGRADANPGMCEASLAASRPVQARQSSIRGAKRRQTHAVRGSAAAGCSLNRNSRPTVYRLPHAEIMTKMCKLFDELRCRP
jgi:hypothetical protein